MTTASMTFDINTALKTIRVFAIGQPITNALATNIDFVLWNGTTGLGKIFYNDRQPVPETFTDPSPYQTYINQWMTGVAAAQTFPLTLAQAIAVKSSLLDSVWAGKRQAPVSVVTSLGTFSFDANDVVSNAMNLANVTAMAETVYNLSITSIGALVTSTNSAIAQINSDLNNTGGISAALNSIANELVQNDDYLGAVTSNLPVPFGPPGSGTTPLALSPSFANVPNVSASTSAAAATPIKILAIGDTSYKAFTIGDCITILNAIAVQRAAEALVRATKQAALAALTTVPLVIAYDTTTGW